MLRASVLDRLMQGETGGGRAAYDYIGLRELRDAVARDLEWLFNSKRWIPWDMDKFPEARASIMTYGLPDFSTYSWRNAGDADSISGLMAEMIRRFEPRLLPQSVHVETLETSDISDFRLCFRIDAVLQADTLSEPISFDTSIEFESSRVNVKGSS